MNKVWRFRLIAAPTLVVGMLCIFYGFYYVSIGQPHVVQPPNPNATFGVASMFLGFAVVIAGMVAAGEVPRHCAECGKVLQRPYISSSMGWVGKKSKLGKTRFGTYRRLLFCNVDPCATSYLIREGTKQFS